ncbi:MAG: Uma2 family endonuclease [Pirellulaceae bacterium]|nr:Uma2 family endonuclease [Planctomycetales bacterium]
MLRAGILVDGDAIELIEGYLVRKMIKSPLHSAATALARRKFSNLVPLRWSVDSQEPITTHDSEPEPDIVVIRGLREQYRDRHPGPGDVGLVVEIADSSLQRDRGWKKRAYASAGIPTYWIVNLVDRVIEVYSQPSGEMPAADYARFTAHQGDDTIPVVLDGHEIGRLSANDLLP